MYQSVEVCVSICKSLGQRKRMCQSVKVWVKDSGCIICKSLGQRKRMYQSVEVYLVQRKLLYQSVKSLMEPKRLLGSSSIHLEGHFKYTLQSG